MTSVHQEYSRIGRTPATPPRWAAASCRCAASPRRLPDADQHNVALETKQAYDHFMALVPDKQIRMRIDITRAAVWPASDEPDYVVGAIPVIDGGMTFFPDLATGDSDHGQ